MSKVRLPEIPWVWAWGGLVLAFPWSNAMMSMATAWLGVGDGHPTPAPDGSRPQNPRSKSLVPRRVGLGFAGFVVWPVCHLGG